VFASRIYVYVVGLRPVSVNSTSARASGRQSLSLSLSLSLPLSLRPYYCLIFFFFFSLAPFPSLFPRHASFRAHASVRSGDFPGDLRESRMKEEEEKKEQYRPGDPAEGANCPVDQRLAASSSQY
jgi:hypothetical protein